MSLIENLDLNDNHFLLNYRSQLKHPGRFHAHQGMEFIYIYQGDGHVMLDHRMYELFFFSPISCIASVWMTPSNTFARTSYSNRLYLNLIWLRFLY